MGPGMQLMVAKRELEKSNADLMAKREYQKAKRTEMDALWEELRKKEDALTESFILYNKFVKVRSKLEFTEDRNVRFHLELGEEKGRI